MHFHDVRRAKIHPGTRVLLRIDANVAIEHGEVAPHAKNKLRAIEQTIRYLLQKKAVVIMVSHLGEPKKHEKRFSLTPVAEELGVMLHKPVKCITANPGSVAYKKILERGEPGSLFLLENIRFFRGETANDPAFAHKLASGSEIFVNDAFASCHRAHASVVGVTKILPSYAGLSLQEEVRALEKILHPKKPLMVILGGAKVSSKINVIESLVGTAQKIFIGGGIANAFLAAQGHNLGLSQPDEHEIVIATNLLKSHPHSFVIPIDVVVQSKTIHAKNLTPDNIPSNANVCDIGTNTIKLFSEQLQTAKTIIWNGPMGIFEQTPFNRGTMGLIKGLLRVPSAFKVAGGGETVMAIEGAHAVRNFSHVSTGGGAMLEFLAHSTLPGIEPLLTR